MRTRAKQKRNAKEERTSHGINSETKVETETGTNRAVGKVKA